MYRLRTIAAAIAVLALPALASASTITLSATSRGSYISAGTFGTQDSGTAIGYYVTGEHTGIGPRFEYRSFFVFDLSSVTDEIVSASFQVSSGIYLGDASETVTLFDVSSPLAGLVAGSGGVGAFADLGSGTTYGSRAFTAADPSVTPVTITLDAAALAALNGNAGGEFALGGALTTISGTSDQLAFGGTGSGYTTQLVLETRPTAAAVPEPVSMLLVGSGLVGIAARKRNRQRRG